jgi:hypothetical protein
MRLYKFGAVELPQASARHQSPVGFRSSLVELRNGGFDQDGNDTFVESKMVSATFWVSESESFITDIDDYIDDLYGVAAVGRARLIAVRRDGTYVSANAKLISARTEADSRLWKPDALDTQNGYDPFTVTWEISYPYWLTIDDESKLLDDGWLADGSFTFEAGQEFTNTFDSGSLSWSPTLVNAGNAPHERMTITIEGLTGLTSVGDLNITNTTTGDTIEWVGTLEDGDVVVIETLAQTVLKNGTTDYPNINLPVTQIPFMSMHVGNNDFTFVFDSIAGGDVDVTIQYSKHFIR